MRRIIDALVGTQSESATDPTIPSGNFDPSGTAHSASKPFRGPVAILLVIVAISASVSALVSGLLMKGSDSGELLFGAVFGGVLGLLIGIPAALIVWLATRRRR
jgi:hypothetical protein